VPANHQDAVLVMPIRGSWTAPDGMGVRNGRQQEAEAAKERALTKLVRRQPNCQYSTVY
jgi:hypothetical protein